MGCDTLGGVPTEPGDPLTLFREAKALLAEVKVKDKGAVDVQRSRLESLRLLASGAELSLDAEQKLRKYVRQVVAKEQAAPAAAPRAMDAARPATERDAEVHALIAGAATRELEDADRAFEARRDELTELLAQGKAAAAESDPVKVAKIEASVEKLRIASEYAQGIRKMASEERIASLSVEIKRLEGAQQTQLAELNNSHERAKVAEESAAEFKKAKLEAESALAVEREKTKGAVIVEGKKGIVAVVLALITFVSGAVGAWIGRASKADAATAAKPSAAQVAPMPAADEPPGSEAQEKSWTSRGDAAGQPDVARSPP